MNNFRIEIATKAHFEKIKAKALYSQESIQADLLYAMTAKDPTATVLLGDIILAIYGLSLLNGVGTIWGIVAEDVYKNKKTFAKATKSLVDTYFTGLPGVRRLQLTIPGNVPERNRWAHFLGFNLEGCLKKFGTNGEDHFIYGKVS